MTALDWIIVAAYMAGVVGMGFWVGRRQATHEDYFLAGRSMGAAVVAGSILATQASAISMIGAPAFVALAPGGGLRWLQYELAVPLAMAAIGVVILPPLFRGGYVTLYEYIQERFGDGPRRALALLFLLSRGLAAGVALYAAGVVLSTCLGLALVPTMLLMGAVTLLYTAVGGIRADIYSDILQLFVLLGATGAAVVWLVIHTGVWVPGPDLVDPARLRTLDFGAPLAGAAGRYGFWPMLLGGLFLYVSYYGCDQSQAQRLLSAPDPGTTRRALLLNGVLRFPFVLLYCWMGLLLAVFLGMRPDFAAAIPADRPDFLVPTFVVHHLPAGLTGLVVAGLFAAAMSSLDSAYNSLSAVTQIDLLRRPRERITVASSRLWTVLWGTACAAAAVAFSASKATAIELVNMVGSVFYGPLLGVFLLGILTRRVGAGGAVAGLAAGLAVNLALWRGAPALSWLWWNLAGCVVTAAVGALWRGRRDDRERFGEGAAVAFPRDLRCFALVLVAAFAAMLVALWVLQGLLMGEA